jgi:hypothetical protein
LNELSGTDTAKIFANVEILYNKQYNCFSCKKKFSEAYRNERRYCTKSSEKPIHKINGINFHRCIGSFYCAGYFSINDIVRNYRNGVLPFSGGLLDQPAKVIEAISYAESLTLSKEIEQQRKAQNGR